MGEVGVGFAELDELLGFALVDQDSGEFHLDQHVVAPICCDCRGITGVRQAVEIWVV
jgi:hypothetical protein